MILHRLRLTNFRGVADREIAFPDHGVVVVCGPNEVGKSSMLEALDLLLSYRDRSTHRDVKAVKPTNADVGAQVEAEISTGPYRFTYRKRFHKKAMTELEIFEPRREQLSADEAHERVEAMLAETVDTKLWDAQRVLQSASTNAVNLSGCDALARALDAAGGETDATPSGDESLLIDRIEAEFQRYFTGTGKATGVWKTAAERLKGAEAEEARWRGAVEEVNDRVSQHELLTASLRQLEESLAPATARMTAAGKAYQALAELREELNQARLVATAAAARSSNSTAAYGQRQQLIDDGKRRGEILVALQTTLADAEQQEAATKQAAETAIAAAEHASAALVAAQQRFDTAKAAAEACAARDTAEKLAARVEGIDEIEKAIAGIAGELTAITLTETALAGIEKHWATAQRIEAQLQADSAAVEFTAPADLTVTVDGVPRALSAGESWTQPVSAAVVVDVPGVLTVRISPGASAVKLRDDLEAAQQLLDQELAAVGVSGIEAARAMDTRRRALTESRTTHTARLEGLCGGEDAVALRTQLGDLRDVAAAADQVDTEAAIAELKAADEAVRTARSDAAAQQKIATAATEAHTGKATGAAVVRDGLKTAEAEFVSVREQLVMLRAAFSDGVVAAQAAADAEGQGKADATVAALSEQYEANDSDAVDAEFAAASDAVNAITGERDDAKLRLHTLTAELGVIGSEGRQGRLDEAQAELERARADYNRIGARAEAAQLLRSTMIRHRDNTRQRYVQPYRTELERLGREVFGDDFEVDVDKELTIQTRTLEGCTVPYDSLSGGAKEQLGILARLAGATLVAKEDTVPVIIDDALGFADPERLDRMRKVLGDLGSHGQVIVLTCTPGRYDGVTGAEVIELNA
ncbi:MAG: AAA family ATPase [Mycobacterium sp.]